MSLVNLTINGKAVSVPEGTKILEAAKQVNIKIPSLCNMKIEEIGFVDDCASCRVCMVTANRKLVPACGTMVREGMVVDTNTPEALRYRKNVVELLLSDHPQDCFTCDKCGICELQQLASEMNIREIRFKGEQSTFKPDISSVSIVKDTAKCVLCRRCETMCNKVQTVGALSGVNRGFNTVVGTFFDQDLIHTDCVFCGQCVSVCPTDALIERDNSKETWAALQQKEKPVIVQIAPAVRVSICEEFGLAPGTISTGKLISALKFLGFDYVFDTNFAADVTIMEEANEFVERLTKGGDLPILTSCCPSWVRFCETQYPELTKYLSTCKSPQGMFSSIARHYFADKVLDKKPDEVIVVSIMPCLSKKYEISRDELSKDGIMDTDISLSTREIARMIREAGIDLARMPESQFNSPLGNSTGAADIFGVTGGVLEAAIRTAYTDITKMELPFNGIDFVEVRGFKGIKEATLNIAGKDVRVAVASSLGHARTLMEELKADLDAGRPPKYQMIEIMACPGGCVSGGGQPFHHGDYEKVKARGAALYAIDSNKTIRKSHKNEDVKKLYEDFIGERGGHNAHTYLHTEYYDKSNPYTRKSDLKCDC
ncbi:NADH-dependent [FeFe] hydrogenase, group A6 [Terrisporobacter sp.]